MLVIAVIMPSLHLVAGSTYDSNGDSSGVPCVPVYI